MKHKMFIINPRSMSYIDDIDKVMELHEAFTKHLDDGWHIRSVCNDGDGNIVYILCDTPPY